MRPVNPLVNQIVTKINQSVHWLNKIQDFDDDVKTGMAHISVIYMYIFIYIYVYIKHLQNINKVSLINQSAYRRSARKVHLNVFPTLASQDAAGRLK